MPRGKAAAEGAAPDTEPEPEMDAMIDGQENQNDVNQNDGEEAASAEQGDYGEYQGGPVSLHAMDLSPSAACGPTTWLTTTTEFAVVGLHKLHPATGSLHARGFIQP
jgi:hypothetical protein